MRRWRRRRNQHPELVFSEVFFCEASGLGIWYLFEWYIQLVQARECLDYETAYALLGRPLMIDKVGVGSVYSGTACSELKYRIQ